jgi:hypothetical protein
MKIDRRYFKPFWYLGDEPITKIGSFGLPTFVVASMLILLEGAELFSLVLLFKVYVSWTMVRLHIILLVLYVLSMRRTIKNYDKEFGDYDN